MGPPPRSSPKIQEVATLARGCDAPMLSHDDSQIETRDYCRALGAQTSEFPMNTKRPAMQKRTQTLSFLAHQTFCTEAAILDLDPPTHRK